MFFTDILNDLRFLQNDLQKNLARSYGEPTFYFGDFPAVQIYANKDHLLIRSEVPGLASGDLDISITDDVVTISGEIKKTDTAENSQMIRRERKTGKFQKTIELPYPVEADRSEANLKNGVLTLTFPIREAVKLRQIAIKAE